MFTAVAYDFEHEQGLTFRAMFTIKNAEGVAQDITGCTLYNGSSGKANRAKLGREYSELPNSPWAKDQKDATVPDDKGDKKDNKK